MESNGRTLKYEPYYIPPVAEQGTTASLSGRPRETLGAGISPITTNLGLPGDRKVKVWEMSLRPASEQPRQEPPKALSPNPPSGITAQKTKSCTSCRLRQIRCDRGPAAVEGKSHPIGTCVPCAAKGLECTPYIPKPRRPNGSGKRIDLAKDMPLIQQRNAPNKRQRLQLSSQSADVKLGDIQLQGALTAATLEFFLDERVTRLPFLGETSLVQDFEAASRRIERLPRASATFLSVILAAGSRLSDHPLFVGKNAPTIQTLSTTPNLATWGRKRTTACRALMDKAKRDIDANSVMTTPSMESIATLVLAQGLLQHETDSGITREAYAAASLAHMRRMLRREETRALLARGEIGWSAYILDAISSTTSGRSPTFNDNDVDLLVGDSPLALQDIFDLANFRDQQPQQVFFDTFRAMYHQLATVVRKGSRTLTGYKATRSPRLNEHALRDFIDGIHLGASALPLLEARAKGLECTPYVPKPRRPNGSGKRIDLAKDMPLIQQGAGPSKRQRIQLSSRSADAQLGDVQLQGALTAATLEFFLDERVTRLPFLGETSLVHDFEAASRRIERLPRPSATFLSVILAAGARLSDHPLFVGKNAPTIQTLSTTPNLATWGRNRTAACRALLDKAKKDIDANSVMTTPSMESIATLVLAQGLLQHETDSGITREAYAAASLAHMRRMLRREETRALLARGEIGWSAYILDAISSTTSGRSPTFNDNDVDLLVGDSPLALQDIFDLANFRDQQPQQVFFDTFRAMYHQLATVVRKGSRTLTGYKATRSPRLNEHALRDFIDGIHLGASALPLLEARAIAFVGPAQQSGAHFTANPNMLVWCFIRGLRMARALQLSVPLRLLNLRLRGVPYTPDEANILVPAEGSPVALSQLVNQLYLSSDELYANRLQALVSEAEALALSSARDLASQLDLTVKCGMPFSMLSGVQVTFASLSQWVKPLLSAPAFEEGGPADFSFTQKIQELGWISTALKLGGWCFEELAMPARWLDVEIEKAHVSHAVHRVAKGPHHQANGATSSSCVLPRLTDNSLGQLQTGMSPTLAGLKAFSAFLPDIKPGLQQLSAAVSPLTAFKAAPIDPAYATGSHQQSFPVNAVQSIPV